MEHHTLDFSSLAASGTLLVVDSVTFFLIDSFNHCLFKLDQHLNVAWKKAKQDIPLHYPSAMATHKNILHVCDSWHHCMRQFDFSGQYLGSFGSLGDQPGSFECPMDIKLEDNGLQWVVDTNHQAIKIFANDGQLQQELRQPQLVANETLDLSRHFGIHSPRQTSRTPFYPQEVLLAEFGWVCRDQTAISFFEGRDTKPSLVFRSHDIVNWQLLDWVDNALLVWSRADQNLFLIHPQDATLEPISQADSARPILCSTHQGTLFSLTPEGISATPFKKLQRNTKQPLFIFGTPDKMTVTNELGIESCHSLFLNLVNSILNTDQELLKPQQDSLTDHFPLDWFLPEYLFEKTGSDLKLKSNQLFFHYFSCIYKNILLAETEPATSTHFSQELFKQAITLLELKLKITQNLEDMTQHHSRCSIANADLALFYLDALHFMFEGAFVVLKKAGSLPNNIQNVLTLDSPISNIAFRFQYKLMIHLAQEDHTRLETFAIFSPEQHDNHLTDALIKKELLNDLQIPLEEATHFIKLKRQLWLSRVHKYQLNISILPKISLTVPKILHYFFMVGRTEQIERLSQNIPQFSDPFANIKAAWARFLYLTMQHDDTEEELKKLTASYPENPLFKNRYSEWLLENGKDNLSKQYFDALLENRHEKVYLAFRLYELGETEALYKFTLEAPECANALIQKVITLALVDANFEMAQSFLDNLKTNTPDQLHEKQLYQGFVHLLKGNDHAAKACFQNLPAQPFARYLYLSLLFRFTDQPELAHERIEKEILILPSFFATIHQALINIEDTDVSDLAKILPDYAWIYFNNRRVCVSDTHFNEALKNLHLVEKTNWQELSKAQRSDYLKTVLYLSLFSF